MLSYMLWKFVAICWKYEISIHLENEIAVNTIKCWSASSRITKLMKVYHGEQHRSDDGNNGCVWRHFRQHGYQGNEEHHHDPSRKYREPLQLNADEFRQTGYLQT